MTSNPRAEVDKALADVYRQEWSRILSTVIHVTRDFDSAEDCTQDAFAQALISWPQDGVPDRPGAWLTTVAVRQALQRRRRAGTLARKLPLLVTDDLLDPTTSTSHDGPSAFDHLPDDRLRLVFTCCHPALAPEARTALTLRLVCGLSTVEVAAAFLVRETTMQARITRAKKKIAASGIPYRTPRPDELPQRLPSVLDTVHLLYSTGHVAHTGDDLVSADIAERSVSIARMLHELIPQERESAALLALFLLTDARRAARSDSSGALVLLRDQDRSRWDHDAIGEGLELLNGTIGNGDLGRYSVMAAIAAVHATAPSWEDTDWPRLVALYDILLQRWPSPVTALNRAVAVAEGQGPAAGLTALEALTSDPALATYHYLPAARAELLDRLGRRTEAAAAFQEAVTLAANPVEVRHLEKRLRQVK